jgi:hypothetical protein
VGEPAIGDDGGVGEVERGDRKIETGTVSAGTAAFGSFFGLALPVSFFIAFLTPSAFLGARPNTFLHSSFGMLMASTFLFPLQFQKVQKRPQIVPTIFAAQTRQKCSKKNL